MIALNCPRCKAGNRAQNIAGQSVMCHVCGWTMIVPAKKPTNEWYATNWGVFLIVLSSVLLLTAILTAPIKVPLGGGRSAVSVAPAPIAPVNELAPAASVEPVVMPVVSPVAPIVTTAPEAMRRVVLAHRVGEAIVPVAVDLPTYQIILKATIAAKQAVSGSNTTDGGKAMVDMFHLKKEGKILFLPNETQADFLGTVRVGRLRLRHVRLTDGEYAGFEGYAHENHVKAAP